MPSPATKHLGDDVLGKLIDRLDPMAADIEDIFGETGFLSRLLTGYMPRPQQIEMFEAIEDALLYGDNLVTEAPTGTGKSFALMIAAIRFALARDEPVVVATAGISLQEQYITKDLPFLRRALPWDFRYGLMKGKGNFLCRDRHAKLVYGAAAQQGLFDERKAKQGRPNLGRGMERLLEWADLTETGDRSDLDFVPAKADWAQISVGSEDCKGKRCRHYEDCFSVAARRKAADAHIIVVNHHLLFADLKYHGAILPPHGAVIIDEAHEAASIARDFLGGRAGAGSIRRLAKKLREFDMSDDAEEISRTGEEYFERLLDFSRGPDYGVRLVEAESVDADDAMAALIKTSARLAAASRRASDPDRAAEFDVERNRCKNIWRLLSDADEMEDENLVIHIDVDEDRDAARLEARPLDVADILSGSLYPRVRSVVMTSATLSVNRSFDHVIGELGVPEPEELIVSSPFDASNRIVVIPREAPCPRADRSGWEEWVPDAVLRSIEYAAGRTLALFTSRRMLRMTAEYLMATCDGVVLVQDDMPKTRLIEEFKRDVSSTLLGTARGFGAGMDVPGEALSCVIIDKIPFKSPGDPIEDAFDKLYGRNTFRKRGIPIATTQLKQYYGRLIRCTSDRGVAVFLDSRLRTKGYGRAMMRSLGQVDVYEHLEDIATFLGVEVDERPAVEEKPWEQGSGRYLWSPNGLDKVPF